MGKVNVTVLLLADGKKIGVSETGAEVIRKSNAFLTKIGTARMEHAKKMQDGSGVAPYVAQWLELTNPSIEGGRGFFLHEAQVESIVIINEVQLDEPSNIVTPAPGVFAGDPFSRA